jgi:hypothetical protein
MLHEVLNGVLVCVHGPTVPSDGEWHAYLDAGVSGVRVALVIAGDSPGPNPRQRALIAKVPNLAGIPTAVVTTSRAARCVVTALSWFGKDIRAFTPSELDDAVAYLGLSVDHRVAALQAVRRMQLTLSPALDADIPLRRAV